MRKPAPKVRPSDARDYGYVRVSTEDQNPNLQIDAMQREGILKKYIFIEKVSGSSRRRPEFEKMIRALSPGDTVTVWKLDRLGRRTIPLMQWLAWFKDNDIGFKSITEQIDFSTPMGRVFASITAAMAQFEVEMTGVRTASGIKARKDRGLSYGPKIQFDLPAAIKYLQDHKNEHGNLTAAAKSVGVSRQALRHHIMKKPALMKLVKPKLKPIT